jgi:hypothetical protein
MDCSFGAAKAGDVDLLRESEREKSDEPPNIMRPRPGGLRSGVEGIDPSCACISPTSCSKLYRTY